MGTFEGNPFGANDLTFYLNFDVTAGQVSTVTFSNFGGSLIDVVQVASGSERPAVSASLSADGETVSFLFSPDVIAGETTAAVAVNTNATSYTSGTIGLVDGNSNGTLRGFAPVAVTPEPSSLCLVGTGLLAACGAVRRKLKR